MPINLFEQKLSLIFTGISGSGKSTLVHKLAKEYNLKVVDVFKYVKPYIDKYSSPNVKGELLKKVYKDLISDIPNLNFDILEIASDWPDEFVPKIVEKLKTKPILIFCEAPLKVCLKRNKAKSLPVPEETLQNQARFSRLFYKNLISKFKFKLIVIDTTKSFSESYQNLKKKLKL